MKNSILIFIFFAPSSLLASNGGSENIVAHPSSSATININSPIQDFSIGEKYINIIHVVPNSEQQLTVYAIKDGSQSCTIRLPKDAVFSSSKRHLIYYNNSFVRIENLDNICNTDFNKTKKINIDKHPECHRLKDYNCIDIDKNEKYYAIAEDKSRVVADKKHGLSSNIVNITNYVFDVKTGTQIIKHKSNSLYGDSIRISDGAQYVIFGENHGDVNNLSAFKLSTRKKSNNDGDYSVYDGATYRHSMPDDESRDIKCPPPPEFYVAIEKDRSISFSGLEESASRFATNNNGDFVIFKENTSKPYSTIYAFKNPTLCEK